jgi:RIO kinase 1
MTQEKFKTYNGVFDEFTKISIEVLKKRDYFEELIRPIKCGKEADVYLAKYKNGFRAVKIYRINTSNFNKLYDYIKFDYRFKNLCGSKRKIILEWCKKEYRNLKKLENHISCPKPIKFLNNIIVMEYIEDGMLVHNNLENPKEFFDKIINTIKIMRDECNLYHCDLSQFNIMIKNNEPCFIDFGQSIVAKQELDFEKIKHFFVRDLEVITNYFNKMYDLKIDIKDIFKIFKIQKEPKKFKDFLYKKT